MKMAIGEAKKAAEAGEVPVGAVIACDELGVVATARMKRLVYGPPDQKSGAVGTLFNIVQDERLNWRMEVVPGVLEDENVRLLQEFFRERRNKREPSE